MPYHFLVFFLHLVAWTFLIELPTLNFELLEVPLDPALLTLPDKLSIYLYTAALGVISSGLMTAGLYVLDRSVFSRSPLSRYSLLKAVPDRLLLYFCGIVGLQSALRLYPPLSTRISQTVPLFILIFLAGALIACLCFLLSKKYLLLWSREVARSVVKTVSLCLVAVAMTGILRAYFEQKSPPPPVPATSAPSPTNDVNVLLIVIDSLRPDHLTPYGYERPTSPTLDRLSREGVLFTNGYAQSTWTKPSVTSLLTSLSPLTHDLPLLTDCLPDNLTTLPEILQKSGYATAGFVTNSPIQSLLGFNKGFEWYDDFSVRERLFYVSLRNMFPRISRRLGLTWTHNDFYRRNAGFINKRIHRWLERNKGRRFFLYAHYMDCHFPYTPPRAYRRLYDPGETRSSKTIARYDGGIRYLDDQLAQLIQKMKALGLYDNTLIIVTADHGEAFGEHELWLHRHGQFYQPFIRVPLIVKPPGPPRPPLRISTPVRLIDIMPTILEALHIPPGDLDGSSLIPLIDGKDTPGRSEHIFLYENLDGRKIEGLIWKNRWKFIHTTSLTSAGEIQREELYNLENDPREQTDLSAAGVPLMQEMKRELADHRAAALAKRDRLSLSRKLFNSSEIEALRKLGYLK
ncbi:MAG TPA: sulfatase [Elusimicrobiota bacterium]|nr:sulfatase [Elusimicrobiota bacterium]